MKRYQVMIDGTISSQSFSFDELLEEGLLDDYDDKIKVRATSEIKWYVAREYPFHLSESQNVQTDYIINEDGTVTRKNNNKGKNSASSMPKGSRVNEYGQVERTISTNIQRDSRLELSTDSLYLTGIGGSRSITVTTNGSWNISLNASSWVHLSQNGNRLTVRIDKNNSSEPRTDCFKLKSGNKEKRVDIYQSGDNSSNLDNSGCSWIVWFAFIIIGARILYHMFN